MAALAPMLIAQIRHLKATIHHLQHLLHQTQLNNLAPQAQAAEAEAGNPQPRLTQAQEAVRQDKADMYISTGLDTNKL